MKTSIVYGASHALRACLPGESVEGITPVFIEAHESHFRQHVPDKIHIDHTAFNLDYTHGGQVKIYKRDGKTVGAWVIPEEYVSRLDDLDAQILALQLRRREVTIEATAHGRLLRVKDLETKDEEVTV